MGLAGLAVRSSGGGGVKSARLTERRLAETAALGAMPDAAGVRLAALQVPAALQAEGQRPAVALVFLGVEVRFQTLQFREPAAATLNVA